MLICFNLIPGQLDDSVHPLSVICEGCVSIKLRYGVWGRGIDSLVQPGQHGTRKIAKGANHETMRQAEGKLLVLKCQQC